MKETIAELRRRLAVIDRLEQLEAENARLIDQNTENGLMAYEWHVKAERYEKVLREIANHDLGGSDLWVCVAKAREALAQADSAKEEKGE